VKRSDIPNIITIFRIGIVPAVVVSLLYEQFLLALILFTVAGISDGLDGYIAKRFNFISRLGSILDPLADKLLLMCTYVTLGWKGLLPLWLVLLVIGRDFVIMLGGLAYHRVIGAYEMKPSWISKGNTFFQIVLGVSIVLAASGITLPEWSFNVLIYTVSITTVLSGLDYVWTWGARAYRHAHEQQHNHKH
jgi:cardiolipin synthase